MEVLSCNSVKNNFSFGFNNETHRLLTRKVLEEFPKMQSYRRILGTACQKPDYDDLGTLRTRNTHFYSLKYNGAHLDFDGEHNALARFKKEISLMSLGFADGNTADGMEHCGRALHYGQDMGLGVHTQNGLLFSRGKKWLLHSKFEEFVDEKRDVFFQEHSFPELQGGTYEDIFMRSVKASSGLTLPTGKNRYEWFYIAQDSFNISLNSTREILTKVNKLIPTS